MSTPILVTIDTGDTHLSPAAYRRAGGRRAGAAHWWLRHSSGAFHSLRARVRGDRRFQQEVRLPPGVYTLGTGKGLDEIRLRVTVTSEGLALVRPAGARAA